MINTRVLIPKILRLDSRVIFNIVALRVTFKVCQVSKCSRGAAIAQLLENKPDILRPEDTQHDTTQTPHLPQALIWHPYLTRPPMRIHIMKSTRLKLFQYTPLPTQKLIDLFNIVDIYLKVWYYRRGIDVKTLSPWKN